MRHQCKLIHSVNNLLVVKACQGWQCAPEQKGLVQTTLFIKLAYREFRSSQATPMKACRFDKPGQSQTGFLVRDNARKTNHCCAKYNCKHALTDDGNQHCTKVQGHPPHAFVRLSISFMGCDVTFRCQRYII